MFVCLSPGGQMVTTGESPKDKLLVGTVDGIFSFARSGDSWASQETLLPGKHISTILYEPATRMLFAGTYGAGLYATSFSLR